MRHLNLIIIFSAIHMLSYAFSLPKNQQHLKLDIHPTKGTMTKILEKQILNPDSIIVENIVQLDNNTGDINSVSLTVKVTNNTKNPIPDLLHCENRIKYLDLYINGNKEDRYWKHRGLESTNGPKTIAIGSTQQFGDNLDVSDNSILLITYGNEFTIQWEYMKIKSKIIKINLEKKTIMILD